MDMDARSWIGVPGSDTSIRRCIECLSACRSPALDFGRLINTSAALHLPDIMEQAKQVGFLSGLTHLHRHAHTFLVSASSTFTFFFSSNVDLNIAGGVIWRGFCLCSCCSLHEFLRAKVGAGSDGVKEWKYSAHGWQVKLVRHMVMSLRCGRKRQELKFSYLSSLKHTYKHTYRHKHLGP